MKFLSGLIIGVLLCLILAGVGGFFFLGQLKDLQNPQAGQIQYSNPAQKEDVSAAELRSALSSLNGASTPEEMLKSLDKIIALRPQEPEAYAAKASLLMQKGDYKGAIENYSKALALNPNSAELYSARATALLMSGDYEGANRDFTSALALNPQMAEAYYNRGVSNVNLARFSPAMADFKNAGKFFSASGNKAGYAQAAQAFNMIKKQGASKNGKAAPAKAAEAAAKLKPASATADKDISEKLKSELTRSLADLSSAIKNGDQKGMLQKFKHASAGLATGEVDTSDFNAFVAAASKETAGKKASAKKNFLDYTSEYKEKMANGDYKGAIAALDKALETSPNNSSLYSQRAAANLQNKDYKAAFNDYSKAIEADKNNASAYLNRARLRASMGDNKGAAADAAAANAIYKQQGNAEGAAEAQNMVNLATGKGSLTKSVRDSAAEALFKEASNAYVDGNYKESVQKFNELAKRQPDVPEVYYNRAIANAALGNKDAALRDYQKTISMNPDLPDAHMGAASILMEQGKTNEARKEIDAALKLNPNIPAAYRMRGMQIMQNGNPAAAAEDFSRAIKLDDKDSASYFSRGLAYAQQGKVEDARADFASAAALASEQGNQELLNEVVKYQNMLEEAAKAQQ